MSSTVMQSRFLLIYESIIKSPEQETTWNSSIIMTAILPHSGMGNKNINANNPDKIKKGARAIRRNDE